MIAEHIGPALRFLRKRRGMTQIAVVEQAGMSKNLISNWERGNTLPSWGSLTKVLGAFRADLVDLHFGIQGVSRGVEPPAESILWQRPRERYFSPLGPALRFLRKRAGWTQKSAATAAGVSNSLLSNWETGTSFPSLRRLDKVLCEVLQMDLLDLHNSLRLLHGKPVLRLRSMAPGVEELPPGQEFAEFLAQTPEVLRWLSQLQQLLSKPEALEELRRWMKEGVR